MPMNFSSQLKIFRARAGLSKTQLADRINVSLAYVSHLEAGREKPTIEKARDIARVLSLSLQETEQLINAVSIERMSGSTLEWLESQPKVFKIPLVSWVKANRFDSINDPFYPGTAEEFVLTTRGGKRMFALLVKGDCMNPEFNDGDMIIVDPDVEPQTGDFVVIKDSESESATFKQLTHHGKKVILHCLNKKYQDIELDGKKQYSIVGKVVEKIKKY